MCAEYEQAKRLYTGDINPLEKVRHAPGLWVVARSVLGLRAHDVG
jgi:hypothetical protein